MSFQAAVWLIYTRWSSCLLSKLCVSLCGREEAWGGMSRRSEAAWTVILPLWNCVQKQCLLLACHDDLSSSLSFYFFFFFAFFYLSFCVCFFSLVSFYSSFADFYLSFLCVSSPLCLSTPPWLTSICLVCAFTPFSSCLSTSSLPSICLLLGLFALSSCISTSSLSSICLFFFSLHPFPSCLSTNKKVLCVETVRISVHICSVFWWVQSILFFIMSTETTWTWKCNLRQLKCSQIHTKCNLRQLKCSEIHIKCNFRQLKCSEIHIESAIASYFKCPIVIMQHVHECFRPFGEVTLLQHVFQCASNKQILKNEYEIFNCLTLSSVWKELCLFWIKNCTALQSCNATIPFKP